MNIKPIVVPLAVAVVTVGTITATASGAFAATSGSSTSGSSSHAHHARLGKDATLQQIQSAGAKATADRITKLNAALTKVDGDKTLTSSDRSTLLSTLHAD